MQEVLLVMTNGIAAICQFLAMLVILTGIVKALGIFVKDALTHHRSAVAIKESRMELGHSFSLGLGFLIGASILKTTLAPSWNDIGQLAAIIAIRTVLNYFLLREISTASATPATVESPKATASKASPVRTAASTRPDETEEPALGETETETREPVMAT